MHVNIGIGTTEPAYLLDIQVGSTAPGLRINSWMLPGHTGSANQLLAITPSTGKATWITEPNVGDVTAVGDCASGACFAATNKYSLLGYLVGIGATAPTAYLNIKSTSTAPIFILKVADTSANDRLVIQSNGNVGIGTTLPNGLLQVGTSPNAPLVVLAGGNVGIGTTAPTAKLEIIPADTTPTQSLYVNVAGSRIIMKSPDGTCSACGPDNADAWACVSVTCP